MLLVIFGAGASYDSVPHLPPSRANNASQSNFGHVIQRSVAKYEEFRPPLANQLFEDRSLFMAALQSFPECKPIIPLLRGGQPVEQQLSKLEEHRRPSRSDAAN